MSSLLAFVRHTAALERLPFVAHAAIETVAAMSFIFRPEAQIPLSSSSLSGNIKGNDKITPIASLGREASLVLCNLGGLLLSMNAIAIVFATRPIGDDTTVRLVGGAFACWHLWPCYRAVMRLQWMREASARKDASLPDDATTKTFGGPLVHLAVHAALCASFLYAACSDLSTMTPGSLDI